jgi:uncharacterized protein (TIGR02328 family)
VPKLRLVSGRPLLFYQYHINPSATYSTCRCYKPDWQWYSLEYPGKNTQPWPYSLLDEQDNYVNAHIYSEHDNAYLEECLKNFGKKALKSKVSDNFLPSKSV